MDAEFILDDLEDDRSREEMTLALRHGSSEPRKTVRALITSSDRDVIRDRLLASGIHRRRNLSYFAAPFEEDWRRLFESRPSLMEVEWTPYCPTYVLKPLVARRGDLWTSSSIFRNRLRDVWESEVVCEGSEIPLEGWINWLLERPPLFEQLIDFVPAFTLDKFFPPRS